MEKLASLGILPAGWRFRKRKRRSEFYLEEKKRKKCRLARGQQLQAVP